MIVKITANEKGNPPGKLAEAELHFSDGPLGGSKTDRIRDLGTTRRLRSERNLSREKLRGEWRTTELCASSPDCRYNRSGTRARSCPPFVRTI
ncbi:MAG: hypothetical protein JWM11_4403 [Planctomycetaceae bacterium]|nr:hypothetical protein [Planctomycetaceae bacterium]